MLHKWVPIFSLLLISLTATPVRAQAHTAEAHAAPTQENRISYWGYRHHELHDRQLIKELQVKTKQTCCSSAYDGECRVSIVDMPRDRVMLDGVWCPIEKSTKIAVLTFGDMKDGDNPIAVVCAEKIYKGQCTRPYCLGIQGPKF